MAAIVESRFAVLQKKKKKPKKPESDSTLTKTGQKQQQPAGPKKKTSHPPLIGPPGNYVEEDPEEKKKRKKKKKLPNQTALFDEWKKKDDEMIDQELEKSIKKVIDLSILDQKRKALVPDVIRTKRPATPVEKQDENQSKILNGSANGTRVKKRATVLDDMIDQNISTENYKTRLVEKDKEINNLKETLDRLKLEAQEIKQRNKTLCTIISEGEIKSKADLVLELENVNKMRDELLTEVNSLNIQLQQERSKVHLLVSANNSAKDKSKKSRLKSESNNSDKHA